VEQPDVRLERVTKQFGDVKAVDDLSLSFDRGGFVALLGPSGCGKTTTLRMIGGFEEPTAGTVYLGEQDVTGLPPYKREVNTVFQNYALFPHMTIFDNVAFGIRQRGGGSKHQIAQQVGDMLELVQLAGFERRKPTQLSGGQAQRVALARALINKPRVLLLDEPLTALDAKLRESLRVDIDQLLRSLGVTAVYVTHDQGEAMALGDRVAVMSQGRVEQIGTPQDIYYRPASSFVADFVGTMNRLSGACVEGRLRVPGGALRLPAGRAISDHAMFRPQDARIVEPHAAALTGRIVSAFFLGSMTRVVVDLGGEQSIVVDTTDRRSFRKGEAVGVDVAADALLILES
jgi:putative spermidine/putrescine transport system ATP-binding protein